MKRKCVIPEYIERLFKVTNIKDEDSGIVSCCFSKIPDKYKIDQFTKIGSRVLVAKNLYDYCTLVSYHNEGTDFFPKGGVKVKYKSNGRIECHYIDSVALFPCDQDFILL